MVLSALSVFLPTTSAAICGALARCLKLNCFLSSVFSSAKILSWALINSWPLQVADALGIGAEKFFPTVKKPVAIPHFYTPLVSAS